METTVNGIPRESWQLMAEHSPEKAKALAISYLTDQITYGLSKETDERFENAAIEVCDQMKRAWGREIARSQLPALIVLGVPRTCIRIIGDAGGMFDTKDWIPNLSDRTEDMYRPIRSEAFFRGNAHYFEKWGENQKHYQRRFACFVAEHFDDQEALRNVAMGCMLVQNVRNGLFDAASRRKGTLYVQELFERVSKRMLAYAGYEIPVRPFDYYPFDCRLSGETIIRIADAALLDDGRLDRAAEDLVHEILEIVRADMKKYFIWAPAETFDDQK